MSAPVAREGLLAPSLITVAERLRPVTEAGVESLIASIRETGVVKDAIHVRKQSGGRWRLIAGAHRLEAVKRLGWAEIAAKVWSGAGVTDDWCRLMEVDDNLAGAEMDALDTAVFLAERKRLYLKLHPETAHATGAALAAKRWSADAGDIESFASATAAKFGVSARHVKRLAMAGAAVLGDAAVQLQAAPKRPSLNDLIVLAKADPDRRAGAIALFADGKISRIADGLKGPAKPVQDPVEAAFKALREAWERAPEAARRRFVADHHAALSVRVRDETERRIINAKLGEPQDSGVADVIRGKFGPRSKKATSA